MKILFLIDTLYFGGKERQLVEVLKGLQAHGDIEAQLVVLSDKVYYSYVEDLGVKIHLIPRRSKKDISVVFKLMKICRQFQPDILHSWESMCSVYATPVAKLLGVTFVNGIIRNAPMHIRPFGKLWLRTKLTFPFSDVIVANSAAGLQAYGVSSDRGRFVHNGFDMNRVKKLQNPEVVRKRLCIKTKRTVGMVGKFNHKKDYKTYLTAAQRIVEQHPDVTFLAVGDGEFFDRSRAGIPEGLRERIIFTGKQKDVESVVNIFDIAVLATYTEGISNAIMEYMALAKPVVATDGGGTSELVLHEKTGFLVRRSDVDDLCEKIVYLLAHPQEAAGMGQRGRERILKEFNLKKMINSYISLYHMSTIN